MRENSLDIEDGAIRAIEKLNRNGRYADDIRDLKRALKQAEEQSPKG